MSRGFVKEEDQEEAPIIPPRAALPDGATNYVTPRGLELLKEERNILEEERKKVNTGSETENRRAKAVIDGKLKLLNQRIVTARVLDITGQDLNAVRFGAKVKIKFTKTGKTQEFKIVGVDEADVKQQKIAFIAPIARAMTGKEVGEKGSLNLGGETRDFEILEINY